jgi:hypothetical protein
MNVDQRLRARNAFAAVIPHLPHLILRVLQN